MTAGLFIVLVALPALAGLALSDCASLDPGACGSKRQSILIWTTVLAAAGLTIAWLVNWLVGKFRRPS